MNCDEFEDRIHQVLDRRANLETDSELCRHAQQCEGCRSVHQGYLRLFEGLNRRELPSLDADFSERVVQLAQTHPIRTRDSLTAWRSRRVLAAWSAIALALLVAWVLPARYGIQEGGVSELSRHGPSEAEVVEAAEASLAESSLPPTIELHLPWPAQDAEWVLFWERFSDRMAGETVESWEVLAGGLRPLAVSLVSAWSGFRDTWPWGRSSDSPGSSPERRSEPHFPAA